MEKIINTTDMLKTLTVKEKETYDLLCEGKTNWEIAELIGLTSSGIRRRLQHIYRKLGISSNDNRDKMNVRMKTIAYSGTQIVQKIDVNSKSEFMGYSEKQIRLAGMKLSRSGVYDSRLINGMVADLLLILEKKI